MILRFWGFAIYEEGVSKACATNTTQLQSFTSDSELQNCWLNVNFQCIENPKTLKYQIRRTECYTFVQYFRKYFRLVSLVLHLIGPFDSLVLLSVDVFFNRIYVYF